MDPRHNKRIEIVQNLFASSFTDLKNNLPFKEEITTQEITKNLNTIDEYIKKYAPKFPLNKIARIDLAILRLSIYELVINQHEPPKVIIDEAVELAKELGGEKSFAFINAILGKVYANQHQRP